MTKTGRVNLRIMAWRSGIGGFAVSIFLEADEANCETVNAGLAASS